MNERILIGGLLRCCIQTLNKRTKPAADKEVVQCEYCDHRMVYRNEAWEWLREGHTP